jgi:hypothetical protein
LRRASGPIPARLRAPFRPQASTPPAAERSVRSGRRLTTAALAPRWCSTAAT